MTDKQSDADTGILMIQAVAKQLYESGSKVQAGMLDLALSKIRAPASELDAVVGGDGMLPNALLPHAKEWYRLCERRFSVTRMSISGELAEAIVEAVSQSANTPPAAAAAVVGWLPIESAPKDARVLVWTGQERYAAHWVQNPFTGDEAWLVAAWGDEGDQALVKPILWHPLTPAPAEETGPVVIDETRPIGST